MSEWCLSFRGRQGILNGVLRFENTIDLFSAKVVQPLAITTPSGLWSLSYQGLKLLNGGPDCVTVSFDFKYLIKLLNHREAMQIWCLCRNDILNVWIDSFVMLWVITHNWYVEIIFHCVESSYIIAGIAISMVWETVLFWMTNIYSLQYGKSAKNNFLFHINGSSVIYDYQWKK